MTERPRPLREMLERVTRRRRGVRAQEEWPVQEGALDVTISATGVPIIKVVNVTAPTTVIPGDTFTIAVDWRNDGESGEGYVQIQDLDTGEILVHISRFTAPAGGHGTWTSPALTMPDRTLRLRIIYGHFEIRWGPR